MFSGSVENTAVVNLSEHSRSAHDGNSHSAHEDIEIVNCEGPTLASEGNSRSAHGNVENAPEGIGMLLTGDGFSSVVSPLRNTIQSSRQW